METPLLIAILIFFVVVLFILAISYNIEYQQGRLRLIRRIKQIGEVKQPEEKTDALSMMKGRLVRFLGSLGGLIKPKSEGEISNLRNKFLKAGYRKENTPVIFWGAKVFLAILFPIIFSLLKLSFLKNLPSLQFMALLIIVALIGFYLPNLWLLNKIAHRKEKILEGFPDALDLMVVCVEAGTGLDAAINRVGEEMKIGNKVVSEEFKLLSLELRAGKPRQDALRNLALRTDLEDISSLVTLLIQTDRFGTSVAQALRVYSDAMRTKRYQRAEEIAAKLPVKLMFPLILFIFPSLFVTILGPGVIRVFRVLLPTLGGR